MQVCACLRVNFFHTCGEKNKKKLNKETKFEEIRRNNLSKLSKANPVMKQNGTSEKWQ